MFFSNISMFILLSVLSMVVIRTSGKRGEPCGGGCINGCRLHSTKDYGDVCCISVQCSPDQAAEPCVSPGHNASCLHCGPGSVGPGQVHWSDEGLACCLSLGKIWVPGEKCACDFKQNYKPMDLLGDHDECIVEECPSGKEMLDDYNCHDCRPGRFKNFDGVGQCQDYTFYAGPCEDKGGTFTPGNLAHDSICILPVEHAATLSGTSPTTIAYIDRASQGMVTKETSSRNGQILIGALVAIGVAVLLLVLLCFLKRGLLCKAGASARTSNSSLVDDFKKSDGSAVAELLQSNENSLEVCCHSGQSKDEQSCQNVPLLMVVNEMGDKSTEADADNSEYESGHVNQRSDVPSPDVPSAAEPSPPITMKVEVNVNQNIYLNSSNKHVQSPAAEVEPQQVTDHQASSEMGPGHKPLFDKPSCQSRESNHNASSAKDYCKP